MLYESEWLASFDPSDPTGTATFTVDGQTVRVEFESFEQFQSLGKMISAAYACGAKEALNSIEKAIVRTIQESRVIAV